MTKSKHNANQQNQRQQTMDDKNPATASSSLPPRKDKHNAKRFKNGPPPPSTPKNIATVTEFDISDIRATYGPKTPSPTGPPTQNILPSNSPSSVKEKGKTRQELPNDLPDQQNVVNDQIMEDVHAADQQNSDEQRTTPPIEKVHVEPIPILSDFVIVAPESALKGKRTTDKEKHVRHFFQLVESFVHTSHRTHDKTKFICAHFCMEPDVAAALGMDTTPIKLSQNEEHPNPKFIKWTELKPAKTQAQIDESKRNTIQVIDIPL